MRRGADMSDSQAATAEAYGDLESPISDVANMASICVTLMEGYLSEVAAMREMDLTGKQAVKLMEKDGEQLAFAVYLLNTMTGRLRDRYFAEPARA
ncbi:MAG: hypothetical protein JWP84_318 [Tardiphaga sp.]|jgi:hypothetical protein|nr:hypothetical protein [Tardiphaga sp.]